MSTPSARLQELAITLPPAPKPVAAYVPSILSGNLLFISGQLPFHDGALLATGRVPDQVSLEQGRQCARQCVLNGLAVALGALGSVDRIARVVRVGAFVQCEPGYPDQPKVANGASELLAEIFGEQGRHARAAVGSIGLPLNAPVEVEFLFEVRP